MRLDFRYWVGLLLLLVSLNATAQTAPCFAMTTDKTVGSSLSFTVNYGLELSIDWGDGALQRINSTNDPIAGIVKGATLRVYGYDISYIDCSESGLTALQVDEISTLVGLNCSHNNLAALDMRSNIQISKVNASFNKLTALPLSNKMLGLTDLIINNNEIESIMLSLTPNIETLICNDNKLNSLLMTSLSKLKTVWCHNNQIKTINVSNKIALTSVICYNNAISTLTVSGSKMLTDIWCDQNKISSLDISSLEAIDYISADQNKIKVFKSKQTVPYLYLNDNNLGLDRLPINAGASDYTFIPQLLELPQTVTQATPIDLSDQLTLIDGSVSNAQFSWKDIDGALTVGTDYTEANGVFTFNRSAGIAICTITSDRFPGLTVSTSPIDIGAVSSIDENSESSMLIFTRNGQLVLRSEMPQQVHIYHISGKPIRSFDKLTGEIEVTLPKGVYLVNRTKVVI